MSTALPVAAIVTGEYRALTLYDSAPADCGAVLVPDDAFAPHLKAGEMAIVDPEDNEPIAGEIYLVTIPSLLEPDGRRLAFVQLHPQMLRMGKKDAHGRATMDTEIAEGWWMRFGLPRTPVIRTYSTMEAAEAAPPSSMVTSDGPMRRDGIRRRIIGRVIGVVMGRGP